LGIYLSSSFAEVLRRILMIVDITEPFGQETVKIESTFLNILDILTMKTTALLILTLFLISSCSTTAKFPISQVVPAAQITAVKKLDKNKNYNITITAKNLASADRLSPPKKTYVVWITTTDHELVNIGQLQNKNGKKSTLKAVTAYTPIEVFITAEDAGNVSNASGFEISRTTFSR
jgi:hypothetical protein